MDDTLQRLLDAEMRAEALATEAEEAHEQTIQETMAEVRERDEAFAASIPALQQSWIHRADERAEKTIAETERRYGERHERLRDIAEEREDAALSAAFQVLIDTRL